MNMGVAVVAMLMMSVTVLAHIPATPVSVAAQQLEPWPAHFIRGGNGELRQALQAQMDMLAQKSGFALQLGWKSGTDEFILAAGQYQLPNTKVNKSVTPTDTFLFGSGTKPFIAAAVMRLVAAGQVSLDDPLQQHIDRWLDKLKPGTSLVGLFGPEAAKVTVGHVLRMESGIQDFDQPAFDQFLLQNNETYLMHSPLEFIENAASQKIKIAFEPGTQVMYSSTNFQLAGLVLLAFADPEHWYDLDIRKFFPSGTIGGLQFFSNQTISDLLTVPGTTGGGFAHLPKLQIYNQSSTILGWTCGNIVGNTGDVAKFLWNLLGPVPKVVPAAELKQMKMFKPLSFGWAKGFISYGAGLMVEAASGTDSFPPTFSEVGTYMGHGGDTYGFLSEQGILYGMNASVSVIANQDGDSGFVQSEFLCSVIQIANKIINGVDEDLKCGQR